MVKMSLDEQSGTEGGELLPGGLSVGVNNAKPNSDDQVVRITVAEGSPKESSPVNSGFNPDSSLSSPGGGSLSIVSPKLGTVSPKPYSISPNPSAPQPKIITPSASPNYSPSVESQGNSSAFSTPTVSTISPQTAISTPGGNSSVTVIQVQSRGSVNDSVVLDETRGQIESEICELSITRISVVGESSPARVTGSINGIQGGNSTSTDNVSRGGVRFGESREGDGSLMGGDDDESEVSSVVNNPSMISQAPDRYGFMGGEQYTHESEPDAPPEIIRRREIKWLAMLDKWDSYMKKDFKTVRKRCRKGIPRSIRGRAWYYLCGAASKKERHPDLFSKLCTQEGKPECIEDIKKDLHRQFPWHEIFAEEGHGQRDLFNVLKSYSILNAKDGYCQAQAPIAAILLMHMPSEDAFWCLVAICEKYLNGYYSPGMYQLQLDGDILFGLLKRSAPPVYKHLKKQKIDPVLYMTEWFLCAFTRTLPWPSVLRVWDAFLCEGVKVLFRVGLVLLKYTLGRSGVLKQCPTMYDTLTVLKNLPNYVTHEQFLTAQILRLPISEDDMRREHYKQNAKRKKAEQKLEAAKTKQKSSSNSNSGSRSGVNNISAAAIYKSHETAL